MKKMNSKTIAYAGVLIAMNIVLARVLAINIGNTLRISISASPIYLAGLWFGPVVGGICGGVADLLGCILQGYAPNPFLIVSAILTGMLPGILKRVFLKKTTLWGVVVIVTIHGIIGSLGFTTVGLHIFYGTPWSVLYASRFIQTLLLTAANSLTVFFLYKSPLTNVIIKNADHVIHKPQDVDNS